MAAPLLSLRDVSLTYGAHALFDSLTLHVGSGDKLALLGRNGTGKSTLMKVMAGLREADSGERFVQPGIRVTYLEQEPDASAFASLKAFILDGLPADMADEEFRADVLIEALAVKAEAAPDAASGGELRRAALARALIGEPDILLLDEPTNHLDLGTILWLEADLKARRTAMVVISHDRTFLSALTNHCLWLDRGKVRRFEGNFAQFDDWRDEVLEQERVERHKLDKRIAEESRWAVEGISARRKRNQGRLRRLQDLRQTRREQIRNPGQVSMSVSSGDASGTRVIEAKSIGHGYGGQVLFSDFSTRIHRGDRVGILGPNGAGKSTLVKILMGDITPDTGTVRLGTNLTSLVIDQKRAALDDNHTLSDVLTGGRGDYVHRASGEAVHVRTYMKEFLFKPEQANTPVSALSGGERGRLLLAAGFASAANLIVLDEPTNDLDMDTLDLLVEVLGDYDGTLLLVSHDRSFLDRTVTSTIVLEGDGTATEYAGGYQDYLSQRPERTGETPADKKVPRRAGPSQVARKSKNQKLSYKDQRALDQLPGEIDTLMARIGAAESALSDPDLYTRDPERFHALTQKMKTLQAELEAKEERWLDLESLKEELEAGI